jgi:NMD protein affecting ribosome stability and mRNA decay
MKDVIRVEFEMQQKMCSKCKKTSSEYYELKLQIRFVFYSIEELDSIKKEVFELISSNYNNINKFEEVDEGFDFFFRDSSELNKLSHLFNDKYFCEEKRSKKIVGRDFLKSKDIWRYTLLIKIINLKRGDRIYIKGKEYKIENFNKKSMVLRDIENASKKVLSYSIVKDYIEKVN